MNACGPTSGRSERSSKSDQENKRLERFRNAQSSAQIRVKCTVWSGKCRVSSVECQV